MSDDTAAGVPPLELRYRASPDVPPPRRIHLEIPGWGGDPERPADGASAQPWHCRPYVEGATYGLELVYPYRSECRVHGVEGGVRFEGPLAAEMEAAGAKLPFGVFARGHYGMDTALDLLPPPGYALRLGPHPRCFTGDVEGVPVALPGHLQRFWPQKFFAVFRAPAPGGVHVFRPGEPYAQLLLVRVGEAYEVREMDADEADDRAAQARQVAGYGFFLARRMWRSAGGILFSDKYKQLLRTFRLGGLDAVRARLRGVEERATPRRRE